MNTWTVTRLAVHVWGSSAGQREINYEIRPPHTISQSPDLRQDRLEALRPAQYGIEGAAWMGMTHESQEGGVQSVV
jgi:hypothetical protein